MPAARKGGTEGAARRAGNSRCTAPAKQQKRAALYVASQEQYTPEERADLLDCLGLLPVNWESWAS